MTGQKLGCDMQVGDVLTPSRFLILGFAPLDPDRHCRGRRLAVNCWGEGRVIFDDGRYGVAQPNNRASWNNERCAPGPLRADSRDDLPHCSDLRGREAVVIMTPRPSDTTSQAR